MIMLAAPNTEDLPIVKNYTADEALGFLPGSMSQKMDPLVAIFDTLQKVYIYILLLAQDKFYVGKTNNPHFRLKSHFNSNGSAWTKLYKPIGIVGIIPNCDNYDEDKITRILMDKYGIENVRGGSFVSVKLPQSSINFLTQMKNGTNDKCFTCGKPGHFAKDCKNTKEIIVKDEIQKSINTDVLNDVPPSNAVTPPVATFSNMFDNTTGKRKLQEEEDNIQIERDTDTNAKKRMKVVHDKPFEYPIDLSTEMFKSPHCNTRPGQKKSYTPVSALTPERHARRKAQAKMYYQKSKNKKKALIL